MEYIGDNKITKSYINGELVTNALKYHKFNQIQYDIDEVRFIDIEFIGEKLKKNIDYNKINKEVINELDKKQERILYIYMKKITR